MRCSATDLDAWRHYRDTDDAPLSELLAQLRRESEPTEAMLAGRAFHRALETCEPGMHSRLTPDGYTFDLELDATLTLPAIREVKATRTYRIDHHRITVVGRVDAIDDRCIDDHKLTTHWDPERLLGSYQWRVYLAVFGATGRDVYVEEDVYNAVYAKAGQPLRDAMDLATSPDSVCL